MRNQVCLSKRPTKTGHYFQQKGKKDFCDQFSKETWKGFRKFCETVLPDTFCCFHFFNCLISIQARLWAQP